MPDRASPQRARVSNLRLVLLLAVIVNSAPPAGAQTLTDEQQKVVNFYWQYAPLAADVYVTEGAANTRMALALASPWLRAEVANSNNPLVKTQFEKLDATGALKLYKDSLGVPCSNEDLEHTLESPDSALRLAESRCMTAEEVQVAEALRREVEAGEPNSFSADEPQRPEDCEPGGKRLPLVPVEMANRSHGWQRVPELRRQTSVRGWTVFVPDLAIDVWRRSAAETAGAAEVEYAIVYRGTVGGGGWVSNFRAVTAVTPFVWDQYRQASSATADIVNQLYQLHALSDALFNRKATPTKVRITAVGHSLGGGLAKYVYLRIPQITRVVAFDPSPVDGSATIAIQKRAETTRDRHPDPRDSLDPSAAIFSLNEHGEILSRLAGCAPGPLWGEEGGPRVRCDTVNFSAGSPFEQHSMSQLACKLSLASRGLPTRRSERPAMQARTQQ